MSIRDGVSPSLLNSLGFITEKQNSAFFKASVICNSRVHARDRMDNISRPNVRFSPHRRHNLGTVGDLYRKFGTRRKV